MTLSEQVRELEKELADLKEKCATCDPPGQMIDTMEKLGRAVDRHLPVLAFERGKWLRARMNQDFVYYHGLIDKGHLCIEATSIKVTEGESQ